MEKYMESPALKQRLNGYPKKWNDKVPLKVKLTKHVVSDLPFSKLAAYSGQTYNVWVNSHGAVSAIMAGDELLGLKPDEFEVTEWHE